MASIVRLFQNIILVHRYKSLLLVLVAIAAIASGAPQFRLDASADSLMLENDKSLDFFREMVQKFGGSDVLVLAYSPKSGKLFAQSELLLLNEFVSKLERVQGVASALSITNVPLLYSPKQTIEQLLLGTRTLLDPDVNLDIASLEFSVNPYYRGILVSPDKKTSVILLTLKSDDKFIALARERDFLRTKDTKPNSDKERIVELDAIIYQRNIESSQAVKDRVATIEKIMAVYESKANIHLAGASTIALEMMSYIKSDLNSFGIAVIVLVMVLLWLIFRQWQFVVLPILACLFCIATMVGILGYLHWPVTVISANFISMLFIINIVVCVHLLVRYREISSNVEGSVQEKVVLMIQQMLKPCIFNVITTMVAFISLVVSGIRPVIDFGWMMAIGVFISLVICFLIVPIGLCITQPKPTSASFKEWLRAKALLPLTEKYYRYVWIAFSTLTIVSLIGISQLEVENRFIDFFKKDADLVKSMTIIDKQLGGTMPFDIVLFPPKTIDVVQTGEQQVEFSEEEEELFDDEDLFGEEEDVVGNYWWNVSGLNEIEQFHDYLQLQPEIGSVLSVATGYKIARDLLEGVELDDVTLSVLRGQLGEDLQQTLLKPFLNDELNATRITMRVKESTPGLRRGDLIARINNYATETMGWQDEQIHFTGLMQLYHNMLISLYRSQILTISMVFLGILLVVWGLFRSFKVAIIALLPNIIASGSILGLMGLMGISLDFMSITIAAITIGIGIDFAIHYIFRYRLELAGGAERSVAIATAHGSIGQSLSYTTTIIAMGFSVFVLSNFIPSIYFGMLISLAMIVALFGTLTLLSSLLLYFRID